MNVLPHLLLVVAAAAATIVFLRDVHLLARDGGSARIGHLLGMLASALLAGGSLYLLWLPTPLAALSDGETYWLTGFAILLIFVIVADLVCWLEASEAAEAAELH